VTELVYSMHVPVKAAAPLVGSLQPQTAADARWEGNQVSKAERQRLIQQLVQQREVGTQRELVHALRALGCSVTQATVSRDIRDLDLQKVRTHLGRARYVLSARERPRDPEQAASHVLRDFARSTAVARNIVVVRSEIGTASTVARAVDNLNHSDVIGTLAGDDTFLIIVKDDPTAVEMQRYIDRLRGA
jgi:transcriptional regulator of arginine metabolism